MGGCGSSCSSGSSDGGHIHACIILDPMYKDGEVVGYVVQSTFLSPRGEKGGPKLVLKEVLELIRVEGRAMLQHGLAMAHHVKPGAGP
jgi:hypothetical protein